MSDRDPLFWTCAVGVAICVVLIVLMPFAVAEFGDGAPAPLACPAAFHDPRCTVVLTP